MTQKKADSDPWLTDPVSRDRAVAKAVVYGIREMITVLRSIRDEQGEENKALRTEVYALRQEVRDLWQHVVTQPGMSMKPRQTDFPECEMSACALPLGHQGNHRGSLRA